MEPILLVHGYSSEGKNNSAKSIYGDLPKSLRKSLGSNKIEELDLSRWISLEDGVTLNDVSFAMDRALKKEFPHLLKSGFHVIIHSTGALVVRNWVKKFSPKPSPVMNLIHLAGANFGSGLAHIGKGQLARWGRFIFMGTEPGVQVLNELEFGSWKTIDLHRHFLELGNDMYHDYQIQEFCLVGSQTFSGILKKVIRAIPIRYVKEDSSDNTVRTSSCNLNYNYIPVTPTKRAFKLTASHIQNQIKKREQDKLITDSYYDFSLEYLSDSRLEIPFMVLYETAHFGKDIGIVDGKKNRGRILPYIKAALKTKYDPDAYKKTAERFHQGLENTLKKVSKSRSSLIGWNKQRQYEGHSQIIFRIRDQFGNAVPNNDITFHSRPKRNSDQFQIERMIQDKHNNTKYPGTLTFYLRTIQYKRKRWNDKLCNIAPLDVEVTAYEPDSNEISYVPMNIRLKADEICRIFQNYRTTIIDITLVRLPSDNVFEITTG